MKIRRCPATVNASEQTTVDGEQKFPFSESTQKPDDWKLITETGPRLSQVTDRMLVSLLNIRERWEQRKRRKVVRGHCSLVFI